MSTDLMFKNILKELEGIHKEFPDISFGRVVQGSMDEFHMGNNINFFDKSSKKFLNALQDFHKRIKNKREKKDKVIEDG